MQPPATTEELQSPAPTRVHVEQTVFAVLFAISFSHMLNDTIQALIPSLYPVLKGNLGLNFTQLGLITFTFQCTASLLQPLVGYCARENRRPHRHHIRLPRLRLPAPPWPAHRLSAKYRAQPVSRDDHADPRRILL